MRDQRKDARVWQHIHAGLRQTYFACVLKSGRLARAVFLVWRRLADTKHLKQP